MKTAGTKQSRTQARGDRARRAIVDALCDLLAAQQISELSVAQIATKAGIDRSVFYFYFRDKYAVLRTALAEVVEHMTAAAFPERPAAEPIADYLVRVFTNAAAVNIDNIFLIRAAIEVRNLDPDVDSLLEAALRHLTDLMLEVVRDEQARSGRQPAPDTEAVVRTLVGMAAAASSLLDLIAVDNDIPRTVQATVYIWTRALWSS